MRARTTEEALGALRASLRAAATDTVGLVTQAQVRTDAAVQTLEQRVRHARTRLQVVVQLASADPPGASTAEVADAEQQLHDAAVRLSAGQDVSRQGAALRRRLASGVEARVPAAEAALSGMLDDIGRYRSIQARSALGSLAVSGPSANRQTSTAGHGGPANLRDADVSALSVADNPLTDEGKGGATASDYDWAVQAWDSVVRPGLDRGATREHFAAKDQARNAPPFRRLADIHDMFLGSDPVALSRGVDGNVTIASGRHRIAAAQRLGIRTLPVQDA